MRTSRGRRLKGHPLLLKVHSIGTTEHLYRRAFDEALEASQREGKQVSARCF